MRHRNMYHLTGLPGWMRFGYSPGWVGRSPLGLGPCAQFLMTGRFPSSNANARLTFLKNQASMLEENLAAVKAQIENLEGDDTQ